LDTARDEVLREDIGMSLRLAQEIAKKKNKPTGDAIAKFAEDLKSARGKLAGTFTRPPVSNYVLAQDPKQMLKDADGSIQNSTYLIENSGTPDRFKAVQAALARLKTRSMPGSPNSREKASICSRKPAK